MSKKAEIFKYINTKICLLRKHSIQSSRGNAELAWLRKGVGKKPGDIPKLWGILYEDMPDDFIRNISSPTREEYSCYIALTLFAMHQQGKDIKEQCMHESGIGKNSISIGKAMRKLVNALGEDSENCILQRLEALSTAKDIDEYAYYLRRIICLLRNQSIPLDYGRLAFELYLLQSDTQNSSKIKLQWARDFYKGGKENDN